MSIKSEITRLVDAKTTLRNRLLSKGTTMTLFKKRTVGNLSVYMLMKLL